MRPDKYGLEPLHATLSCKFIELLNLPDILPHTSGRNHSSPNENFPGARSQPARFLTHAGAKNPRQKERTESLRWQRGGGARSTSDRLQAQIPDNYTTLISQIKKYSQKRGRRRPGTWGEGGRRPPTGSFCGGALPSSVCEEKTGREQWRTSGDGGRAGVRLRLCAARLHGDLCCLARRRSHFQHPRR